jgi:DNA repair protein RecN (Recombination protein N)
MLTYLCIDNFTIISQLELEFKSGMTILTGETGAGKSILIDALLLTLGGRADSAAISPDKDRCTITASFDISQLPLAQEWLSNHELEKDVDCVLRRVITTDGRSRAFINDQTVSIQSLREIGHFLVNIHGQHEHQTLLKADKQRSLLDTYAAHLPLCKKVSETYTTLRHAQETLSQLRKQTEQGFARQELLTFQVSELDKLDLQENELTELDRDQKQLANADHLLESSQTVFALLSENPESNVSALLSTAAQQLMLLQKLDPKLSNAFELINSASVQIKEAANDLSDYLEKLELNPERLQFVEQRLSAIYEMARKHRVSPTNLFKLHFQLREELNQLQNSDDHLSSLEQEIEKLSTIYQQAALELSTSRQKAAQRLEPLIQKSMHELGMPGGKFSIQFEILTECSMNGMERVEFYVSTNPGQNLQPLSKVVSGGELSRISLAIHVLTAANEATPTLIFDEVDVGIGGGTAEIVGRLLRTLSESTQIFCVTHLPQVAALGHHHFQISKTLHENSTQTHARLLDKKSRIEEIARMLGGIKITKQTLAHAKEMIEAESVM